jgi:predicted DNA-binding ribbon-helix-helix protein
MLRKRSLSLAGHTTSMAAERGASLTSTIAEIDAGRGPEPLASACRVAALAWSSQGA